MAQFLRPNGFVSSNTGWTGVSDNTNLYNNIDESAASNTDYIYSQDNPAGYIEFTLSAPGSAPDTGTCTARFRQTQSDSPSVGTTGGTATSYEVQVQEGITTIATSGSSTTTTGAWSGTLTFTFSSSLITNWSDVRVRLNASGGGGSPSNRRGVAYSWFELEVPDPPVAPSRRRTLRVS